jgi:hypothetical protein
MGASNDAEKSVSRSVSMSLSLWNAADLFAEKHGGRSPWIGGLVTEALAKAGALPDDPKARELTRLAELIDAGALDEVRAMADAIEAGRLAAAGAPA